MIHKMILIMNQNMKIFNWINNRLMRIKINKKIPKKINTFLIHLPKKDSKLKILLQLNFEISLSTNNRNLPNFKKQMKINGSKINPGER